MGEVNWLSDSEQQIWRALLHAKRSVDRAIDVRLQTQADISTADFSVLVVMSEAEDETVRMRELCDALSWDRSRMSHQITRMEKRGLVTKHRCEKDNRGIDVVLTDRGREVITEVAPDHVNLVRKIVFDVLDGVDFDLVMPYLKRIVAASEEAIENPETV